MTDATQQPATAGVSAPTRNIDTLYEQLRQLSQAQDEFANTETGSPEEDVARARVNALFADLSYYFGRSPLDITERSELVEYFYDEALKAVQGEVRNGLAHYMDSFFGDAWATPTLPPSITFAVLCSAYFPGMDKFGLVDDASGLGYWLSQRMMIPESRIQVSRRPVDCPVVCASLTSVAAEVFSAKLGDEPTDGVHWTKLPEGEDDGVPSLVVFLVTVLPEHHEQAQRLHKFIEEGLGENDQEKGLYMPFQFEGNRSAGTVTPHQVDYPFSAMIAGTFSDAISNLESALELLRSTTIGMENVHAEIRMVAGTPWQAPGAIIELRECTRGALLIPVSCVPSWLVPYFIADFLSIVEEYDVGNACFRPTPNDSLEFFFDEEPEGDNAEAPAT